MTESPENDLIARCRRGESPAWEELFDQHYPAVGRYVFQLSPDFSREDVEEICQEVFLAVVKNLNSFQGASSFRTWAFRIAANKARDALERRQAAKRGGGQAPISLQSADPETGCAPDPPSSAPGPDQLLVRREEAAFLRRALDVLGGPCRDLIELRYFGEQSYEELAEAFEMNPKTVSSRLSKCLDRLEQVAVEMISKENSGTLSV